MIAGDRNALNDASHRLSIVDRDGLRVGVRDWCMTTRQELHIE